jgi:hypothetical protein
MQQGMQFSAGLKMLSLRVNALHQVQVGALLP